MIKYEHSESSFFENNKNYCHKIEEQFKDKNLNYSGFCNEYGYEIQSGWQMRDYKFHIKIKKDQSTQNGVILPVDALQQTFNTLKIDGIDKSICLRTGKSALKRFFMKFLYKSIFPAPIYIFTKQKPEADVLSEMSEITSANNILKLNVSGGKLFLTAKAEIKEPLKMIETLERIISGWH